MSYRIERELERFKTWESELGLPTESLCDYGFCIRPRQEVELPEGKRFGLLFMGLTHGNEWAGSAVLNGLLAYIDRVPEIVKVPVAFVLANPWAALENKRFRERDLNRSFARESHVAAEHDRARELEPVLAATCFMLDYHQTIEASERPFFIFPFSRPGYQLARAVEPRLSIVSHWGQPFSAEGLGTDGYVNGTGGVGISIELGHKGFDPYQIALGFQTGLGTLQVVSEALVRGQSPAAPALSRDEWGGVYTWKAVRSWPKGRHVRLRSGLYNFMDVQKGQILGDVDGTPLTAEVSGKLIFPKFLSREEQADLDKRPTELYRIMGVVDEGDLP